MTIAGKDIFRIKRKQDECIIKFVTGILNQTWIRIYKIPLRIPTCVLFSLVIFNIKGSKGNQIKVDHGGG